MIKLTSIRNDCLNIWINPDNVNFICTSGINDSTIIDFGDDGQDFCEVKETPEQIAELIFAAKIDFAVRTQKAIDAAEAPPEAPPSEKPKRQYTTANFCAMTCQEGAFWRYLREVKMYDCKNADDAKSYILMRCRIDSRAKLDTDKVAEGIWKEISADYKAWGMMA